MPRPSSSSFVTLVSELIERKLLKGPWVMAESPQRKVLGADVSRHRRGRRAFGGTERFYGTGGEEMATSSLHLTDGVPRCPSERLEQVGVRCAKKGRRYSSATTRRRS